MVMSMGFRESFKKGTVEMMILSLLTESDMYGYQLSQLISERSRNIIQVPEGSMYPTLYRLLDGGFISDRRVQVGKRMTRIYYHLEPSGRVRFREMLGDYHLFADGLQSILSYCNLAPGPGEEAK